MTPRRRSKIAVPTPEQLLEKVTEEALALPEDARAALAVRLVESLDPLRSDAVRAEWAKVALRRREEVRSGAVAAVSETEMAAYVRSLIEG